MLRAHNVQPLKPAQIKKQHCENLELWLKPLLTAAIGTAAARHLIIPESEFNAFNMTISTNTAIFGALAASSFLGELLQNKVLPHIARSDKLNSVAGVL